MNIAEAKKVLETALLCTHEPLSINDLKKLYVDPESEESSDINAEMIRQMLDELRTEWADKGVEVVSLSTGWRFQSRKEMKVYLERLNPEKPPKYTRATLETLAIIAYRQPATRGVIERIRGVDSGHVVRGLLHRRLIYEQGRAETPGRPILYGTSMEFMERFGLTSLDDLPPLEVEIAAQLAQAEADAKEAVEESPRDPGDGATSGEEANDGVEASDGVDVSGAEEEAPPAQHDTAADG